MTLIRSLAFGDLTTGWWGVAWIPGDDPAAQLAWRHGREGGVVEARLQADGQTEPWRLEGERLSLRFLPAGAVARADAPGAELSSVEQLCTVSGRWTLAGSEQEISCLGWRARLEGAVELDQIDSFRQTSAWFENAEGFSLVALRPRRARGHDSDLVAAAVLEPEPAAAVSDPRLSTTYDAAGLPERAGLELWFEEDPKPEDADPEPEEAQERFPRRAAGEAIATGVGWEVTGFKLHATPLRWHSRGSDGAGMYLLGRRD